MIIITNACNNHLKQMLAQARPQMLCIHLVISYCTESNKKQCNSQMNINKLDL